MKQVTQLKQKPSSTPIPIFVINLPRAQDRREYIANEMQKWGLRYQLFEAEDGIKIGKSVLEERYGTQLFQKTKRYGQLLSLGAAGALLSHLKVYDYIIANHIEVACVMEDDVRIHQGFIDLLESPILQDDSWDVLLLEHYSDYRQSIEQGGETSLWKRKICDGHYIARPAEYPYGSMAYLIRNSAAHKLKKFAYPLRMPADWVTSNAELAGVKLRMITPPCVTYVKHFRESTSIEKLHGRPPPTSVFQKILFSFLRFRARVARGLMRFGVLPKLYTKKWCMPK